MQKCEDYNITNGSFILYALLHIISNVGKVQGQMSNTISYKINLFIFVLVFLKPSLGKSSPHLTHFLIGIFSLSFNYKFRGPGLWLLSTLGTIKIRQFRSVLGRLMVSALSSSCSPAVPL